MPAVFRLVGEYTRGFESYAGTIPPKRQGEEEPPKSKSRRR
jgi:hypothetical protein